MIAQLRRSAARTVHTHCDITLPCRQARRRLCVRPVCPGNSCLGPLPRLGFGLKFVLQLLLADLSQQRPQSRTGFSPLKRGGRFWGCPPIPRPCPARKSYTSRRPCEPRQSSRCSASSSGKVERISKRRKVDFRICNASRSEERRVG